MTTAELTEAQVRTGLGALKAIAGADGVFAEEENVLIEAAGRAFGLEVKVDAIEAASAEQVAKAITDPVARLRVVQAMIVTAAIDGDPSKPELALIDAYSRVLEVEEPRVKNLRMVLAGQLNRLRFDFMRRAPLPRQMLAQTWKDEKLTGLWKFFRGVTGKGVSEPELAWKYKRLGLLPKGTFGREFWEHMTARGFAFPGEPGGLIEVACHHDLTHVLTGYDTDPSGEVQIASFTAGFYKEDPFSFVFMVLLLFHLGVKLQPIATEAVGHFDPNKAIAAMQRGARLNRDLTNNWDYWPELERPIEDVRRDYGIG
jgi:hypothetical protein